MLMGKQMLINAILLAIHEEVDNAERLHPDWPECNFRQLAIVSEEAGEVAKAVLHLHYENGSRDELREELIQTAAMCVRMIKNL